MSLDVLRRNLAEHTEALIQLAKGTCKGNFSENVTYILSEIDPNPLGTAFDHRKKRVRENNKKLPIAFEEASEKIAAQYANLYDVQLFIHRARREQLIILKTALSEEHQKRVSDQEPMYHVKVSIPPYRLNETEKFDVNWEHTIWNTRWRLFWRKRAVSNITRKSLRRKFNFYAL